MKRLLIWDFCCCHIVTAIDDEVPDLFSLRALMNICMIGAQVRISWSPERLFRAECPSHLLSP